MKYETHESPIWRNFDNSLLPLVLRFDGLSPYIAIPLLCNIDTDRSVRFDAWSYFGLTNHAVQMAVGNPHDNMYPERDWMTKDYPEYWRIRLLSDDPANCPRCWYESLAGIADECERWRNELFTATPGLEERGVFCDFNTLHQLETYDAEEISEHSISQNKAEQAWKIYFSNPDHDVDPSRTWDQKDYEQRIQRPPIHFVDWAESKGIEVPWRDWAKARGYLAETSIEPQLETKESPAKKAPRAEATKRIREKKLQIDELRRRAQSIAIRLKRDGIRPKYITVKRICDELLRESFSNGEPFTSRWRTADGMRSHLKCEYHPHNTEAFRKAKSDRGNFNR